MTLSPTASCVMPLPISVITPMPSCPSIRPISTSGTSPFKMCRSVPQMVVATIFTITSVGSLMTGSGTSSQLFFPGPL